jgi:hypothetical protein
MANVPRPLIALLIGTVAFFALWTVALKPSSSSSSSSGAGQYSSAIQAAHNAVSTANAASAAHGGTVPATTPATATAHPAAPASAPASTAPASTTHAGNPGAPATAAAHAAATTATVHHVTVTSHKAAVHAHAGHARAVAVQTAGQRYAVVQRALHEHKVLALLFYNPMATDDRDVKAELKLVPTLHGAVVTEAIPLAELSRYTTITSQVEVNQSPTLVVIDRARGASTIVGFTTDYEISNRVRDALAVPVS